jgi:5-formyltetrahydrofolate cyclo-ligase
MDEASDGLRAAKQRVRAEVAGSMPDDLAGASALLVARLEAVVGRTDRVITFSHLPDEPDLSSFVRPRMLLTRTPEEGWLTIHAADAQLERHRWGFLQPVAGCEEVDPEEVHVVLVPGVAFGEDGSRLGHGKGYYDELLSRLPLAVRVGITWECRVVDEVPSDEHDIAMHAVVTEDRVRRIAP